MFCIGDRITHGFEGELSGGAAGHCPLSNGHRAGRGSLIGCSRKANQLGRAVAQGQQRLERRGSVAIAAQHALHRQRDQLAFLLAFMSLVRMLTEPMLKRWIRVALLSKWGTWRRRAMPTPTNVRGAFRGSGTTGTLCPQWEQREVIPRRFHSNSHQQDHEATDEEAAGFKWSVSVPLTPPHMTS